MIVAGGVLMYATAARAAPECEIDTEYAIPYWLSALMIRECENEDGSTVWLWDVALLADVTIGEEGEVLEWPDASIAFGQEASEDDAIKGAIAWVDANQSFVEQGGARGPLADRTERFLADLAPAELSGLRVVFDEANPAIWPLIEQMRVAETDPEYLELADSIGPYLADVDRGELQDQILDAIGFGNGLSLRSILADAGVL